MTKRILLLGLLTAFVFQFSIAQDAKDYYFSVTLSGEYEEVSNKVKKTLKDKGFGVITEVDMHQKLKAKLDVDIKRYRLLGVCNPKLAYEALQVEENIGVFLPCKVIVKELDNSKVEVVSINPSTTMVMLNNDKLTPIADKVTKALKEALDELK